MLEARYLRRDPGGGACETAEELFERVARAVARAELLLGSARRAARREAEYHDLLTTLDFLPNSPTLLNAGTSLGQLSACFVLPVADNMESIFGALTDMAIVQRTGGGTGFAFSHLRPAGDPIASSGGKASGPVSFMGIFDCATEHIRQGGRRRGANMGILRADHPDILEFIQAKRDGGLRNFNLSVSVTDGFMRAARAGGPCELIHPGTGRTVRTMPAGELFDTIVTAAWATGDPGMLFLDRINRDNPTPSLGAIEATNPCGEIPLLGHEACTLGSINLAHMLTEGAAPALDTLKLARTTHLAVRFLDDVVEVNRSPTPEIARMSRGNRKIGLGVMGFAEMLVRLGIPYQSDEAVRTAESLMACLREAADGASEELACERGCFPNWATSVFAASGRRIRNATRTAIAPTGTIGILAGTSAGIEPLFALAYRRRHTLGGEPLREVNPLVADVARARGIDPQRLLAGIMESGSLAGVPECPADLRRLLATALEIGPEGHLRIQASFQRQVDNAVSKTVNLPEDTGVEAVAEVYRRAWELGLKGITVYRYGSRPGQVLELGADEEAFHYDHAARCDPMECRI